MYKCYLEQPMHPVNVQYNIPSSWLKYKVQFLTNHSENRLQEPQQVNYM